MDVGAPDLITALPDDMLVEILVRLRCPRAAARTGGLSRSWRGHWARLPIHVFRGVALGSVQAALASIKAEGGPGASVTLLDISVPEASLSETELRERVPKLLDAAAELSPVELRLAVWENTPFKYVKVAVPRFPRAASVELQGLDLAFADQPCSWQGFPALERLSLTSCRAVLTNVLRRCPRLHVLRLRDDLLVCQHKNIIIKSSSLQELDVENRVPFLHRVHIDAPALKRLAMSFASSNNIVVSVSVSAPVLEKVSWRCRYSTVSAGLGVSVGLGPWCLLSVRLQTAETNGQLHPHVHVLSLFAAAHTSYIFSEGLNLTTEIERHMVTLFSVLELHVQTSGHVFGAFALHVLDIERIRTDTESLKVILLRSEDNEACPANCACELPNNNWRSQTISMTMTMTKLEKVEIRGFQGEGHEFDFLKLVFSCAPNLKTMSVRLADGVEQSNYCCQKIHDVFKTYPSVKCNVDLN
ncbi:hypothetical protein ACQJBY_034711 [Aegilops geniculata]